MTFNSVLNGVKSYEAGKPIELVVRDYGLDAASVVKLASNENPYGAAPEVIEAVKEYAHKMSLYPDDSYYELKDTLCRLHHVLPKELILGAGSDQVIEFIAKIKLHENSKVLMSGVTFAMYEIYAKQQGATIVRTKSAMHVLSEFKELYALHKPDIVFICQPNNPMGDCLGKSELEELLSVLDDDCLAVVDCAYMEFASFKDKNKEVLAKELIAKHKNAVYLGTFSKAYGLGGMRIGYGIAAQNITEAMYKVRPPFNVANLSAKAALEALKYPEFVERCIRSNFAEMKRYEEYAKAKGLEYVDCYTNFITMFMGQRSSKELAQKLLEVGVIVRDLSSYGVNGIRVTIGTPVQNDRFFAEFDRQL